MSGISQLHKGNRKKNLISNNQLKTNERLQVIKLLHGQNRGIPGICSKEI